MKGEISHTGVVRSVTAEKTTVDIVSSSACSQCHAKGLCGMNGEITKSIAVATPPVHRWTVGDTVEVVLGRNMGLKAVLLAYVAPLAVLVVAVVIASSLGCSDLVTGLAGLVVVALWYLVLFLFRSKISSGYSFYIK